MPSSDQLTLDPNSLIAYKSWQGQLLHSTVHAKLAAAENIFYSFKGSSVVRALDVTAVDLDTIPGHTTNFSNKRRVLANPCNLANQKF